MFPYSYAIDKMSKPVSYYRVKDIGHRAIITTDTTLANTHGHRIFLQKTGAYFGIMGIIDALFQGSWSPLQVHWTTRFLIKKKKRLIIPKLEWPL